MTSSYVDALTPTEKEALRQGKKIKKSIKKSELDEMVENFNDYSKSMGLLNIRKAYHTKKIPDEAMLFELEIPILDEINAFYYQLVTNGTELQYKIMMEGAIRVLEEIRKEVAPKMSEHEFNLRCSGIVIIVNIDMPPDYTDKTRWRKFFTRSIF